MFREEAISAKTGFHAGQVELVFGIVGFCGGRETGEPGERPSEQGKNQ